MEQLMITAITAAALAILMMPLSLMVSLKRASLGAAEGELTKYVFGDGNNDELRRRARAFGNLTEYAPMCLVLLGIIEFSHAPSWLVYAVAGLLLTGRFLHTLGMLFASSPAPRGLAMMMTYLCLLLPAGWILLQLI